jgi:FkbM family methyltransferase
MALERILEAVGTLERRRQAIDIGANRGDYTIALAGHYDRVTAFEPDPETFRALKTNISSAAVDGVTLVNKAVSDRDGELVFYRDLRPEWGGMASSVHVLQGLEGQTEEIRLPCQTLDAYCAEHDLSPDFIKIDVEGHEPAVIAGAWKTLSRLRPLLVFEFWETWFHRGYNQLFADLEQLYELSVLQTGDPVRSCYMETDGRLDREPTVVDILCRPKRHP